MLTRLLTFSLLVLSPLLPGCGQEGADLFLELDRSKCRTRCELTRFDFELQQGDPPAGACASHRTTQLASDLEINLKGLEIGEHVTAVVVAFCPVGSPAEVESAECCIPLARCLRAGTTNDPDCIKARSACPAKTHESDPWANLAAAEAYFQSWCTLRENCAQCSAISTFTLKDGERVNLALQPTSFCASPTPSPPCL
ncbi:MAG: hypothetical protein JRH20_10625 [Deltaproteobacteria bacterium]|nr:hypothetical protein [Deltaproteobacteria bacterium]